jgi:Mlc titration factor MtfA (ptsG expression regulator)
MNEVLLTGGVSILTSTISSIITWILARRKYNAEVNSTLISNLEETLEFYKKLSDDNKKRLDETIQRSTQLEVQVASLKDQIITMMNSICMDLSCTLRKRDMNLFNEHSKSN